jgi:hypothetical protein
MTTQFLKIAALWLIFYNHIQHLYAFEFKMKTKYIQTHLAANSVSFNPFLTLP